MRSYLFLALALATAACSRQRYSVAPAPAPTSSAPAPKVVLAAAPSGNAASVSSVEAVSYLMTRAMEIPVVGIAVSQLRDTFDEGRDAGRTHRALDILAPRGTAVIAADSGRVIRVGSSALGGNVIYASDPLGRIVYYYAHLDAFRDGLVQGATIARGDTLGFVGTTGNAPRDTPHLHFQVMRMPSDGKYWDGEPINPYPLLLLTHDVVRQ
jgi:peptidoglycan LD-endopeptidase LytH